MYQAILKIDGVKGPIVSKLKGFLDKPPRAIMHMRGGENDFIEVLADVEKDARDIAQKWRN